MVTLYRTEKPDSRVGKFRIRSRYGSQEGPDQVGTAESQGKPGGQVCLDMLKGHLSALSWVGHLTHST